MFAVNDRTTGDIRIDALLYPASFLSAGLHAGTSVEISYRFMERAPTADEMNYRPEDYPGFEPMDAVLQRLAREAMAHLETQVGVRFREVGSVDEAMLRFGTYTGGPQEYAAGIAQSFWRFEGGMHHGAEVYINRQYLDHDSAFWLNSAASTMLHELGHVLGLKHPGPYSPTDQGPFLPEALDVRTNTIMSYYGPRETQLGEFDLLALRHLFTETFSPNARQWVEIPVDASSLFGSIVDDVFIYDASLQRGNGAYVVGDWGDDWLAVRFNDPAPFYLTFDGGPGVDQAVLNVASTALNRFTLSEPGHARLDLLSSGNGWQTVDLRHTERVHFTDLSLALDLEGNAGDMFRLYQAALDRGGDLTGLGYWIELHDAGTSLVDIAGGFLESEEFQGRLGNAWEDTSFVSALYQNVLGREGEATGMGYWLEALGAGATDRSAVLVNFSESAENRANVADVISEGIAYTPWSMVEIA